MNQDENYIEIKVRPDYADLRGLEFDLVIVDELVQINPDLKVEYTYLESLKLYRMCNEPR